MRDLMEVEGYLLASKNVYRTDFMASLPVHPPSSVASVRGRSHDKIREDIVQPMRLDHP